MVRRNRGKPAKGSQVRELRALLVGDYGVGKSSLLLQFVDNAFQETQEIRFVDDRYRTIEVGGELFKLKLVDTRATERFRSLGYSIYRTIEGIILVYDVTNEESFTSIRNWLEEINQRRRDTPFMLLVGNKCDLVSQRVVDWDSGALLARELRIPFVETSSKDPVSVDIAFAFLSEGMIQTAPPTPTIESKAPPEKSCKLQ